MDTEKTERNRKSRAAWILPAGRAAATVAAAVTMAMLPLARVARAQSPMETQSPTPAQPLSQMQGHTQRADGSELTETKARLAATTSRLLDAQKILQDWPDLARYRDANANLAAPAVDEKRVVFMGDSITDMWAQPRFGGFFPGKPYVDRGISGQTTPQMLLRFRPDVIALQPKVVLILAGTNDLAGNTGPMTLEEIEGNLQSMAELAKLNGIRVVLASVMPVSDYGHAPDGSPLNMTLGRPPEKILRLNAWIKKYAEEHHQVYLDYFSAMVDEKGFLKADLSVDGLHPNAAGYAVMAPLAEEAIAKALRSFVTPRHPR
jgi:lysophospholipase L1-like esterase